MSDCFVQSNHAPASSMQIFAPASASTCAATPPPAPEPTITTSYVFGVAFTCAMYFPACATVPRAVCPSGRKLRLIYKLPYPRKSFPETLASPLSQLFEETGITFLRSDLKRCPQGDYNRMRKTLLHTLIL